MVPLDGLTGGSGEVLVAAWCGNVVRGIFTIEVLEFIGFGFGLGVDALHRGAECLSES